MRPYGARIERPGFGSSPHERSDMRGFGRIPDLAALIRATKVVRMSIAEAYDMPVARAPLVPPSPPRAPDDMNVFGRMKAIRVSPIGMWGQRAYEEDIVQGRVFGRNSFILNAPDAIRHVLVDNYENYTRTPAGFRVLRPILGEGLLIAEGRAWKHQRRTLAPAFTPRAVTPLVPHMLAATDETVAKLSAASNAPVDLREAMQRMALEIAGRTMFSFGMDRHGAALRDFVMEYGERLARPHFLDLLLPLSWPSPQDISRARFRKRWTAFVGMLMAELRAASGPDTIAGLPVKKKDVILIAPWLLHRHEKLWRDPNAFIPSRFMTGTPPDRFAYLPFGVGARVCIGAHFALVEATLALAKMIGAFRVTLVDKEPVMPIGVVTTQPDRSPMFAIRPR